MHPWWPHVLSFPRFLDPVSWLWLSTKGYAMSSSIGVGWVIVVGLYVRRHNCHARWCPRLGRHHVEGTPFRVCRLHHPTIPDRGATVDAIHAAHRDAQDGAVKVREGQ